MSDLLRARSAVISPCGLFRYRLDRDCGGSGPVVAGLMVNGSTADGEQDDHTIRKWFGFTRPMNARRFIIGNKFGFRATDIKRLRTAVDPIGPENDRYIEEILSEADVHIVAWGPLSKLPPHLRNRWRQVVAIADRVGCNLMCWGTAQDGHPRHPLMLAYDTPLVPWNRPSEGHPHG